MVIKEEGGKVEKKVVIESLKCCVERKCGVYPYQDKGVACKYRLMADAAKVLEGKSHQIEGGIFK